MIANAYTHTNNRNALNVPVIMLNDHETWKFSLVPMKNEWMVERMQTNRWKHGIWNRENDRLLRIYQCEMTQLNILIEMESVRDILLFIIPKREREKGWKM